MGNTRALVKQNGSILDINDYYAFGLEIGDPMGPSPDNNYKYNGKEWNNDLSLNAYDYGARFYDPIIGRWNVVDPLATEFPWQSGYASFDNNPINKIDPDGRAASPIYDENGDLLGTDDQGLQGKAIVMNKSNFKQGMNHEEALTKDLGTNAIKSEKNRAKFAESLISLPGRPDYDGVITDADARRWWKKGNGGALYADQSQINLTPVTTKDFKDDRTITNNFFFDPAADTNVGRVYGTLTLTLLNSRTGETKVGARNNAFLDSYDFSSDGRLVRDAATWGVRNFVIGGGTSFNIYGYGNNPKVKVIR